MSRVLVVGGTKHAADSDMSAVYAEANQQSFMGAVCECLERTLIEVLPTTPTKIDILDIYYHGSPGVMRLGRDTKGASRILFSSDGSETSPLYGANVAMQLRQHLSPTAHVRLLGCNTAVGASGRMLVYKLAKELGEQRVVSGTIDNLELTHFKKGWFDCDSLLFSSLAATDELAPDWEQRRMNKPRYRPTNPAP